MSDRINNITKKVLNTDCLHNDVLKHIPDSDIPFVSKTSKKSIAFFLEDNCIDTAKELWKNLLIDSICILKVNDSRETIYKDSAASKTNFITNFEKIRKTSSYGVDELDKYFDDFIQFESVLYGTDEHYRDHVEHVLQVWAIGISLLEYNELSLSDGFNIDNGKDFNFELDIPNRVTTISKSELWAMWSLIALCHDLGYPIEKTSKINKQAKKIIAHFGNMNFVELNYSFDIINTFLVEKFLNIISSKAIITDKQTSIQTKYRDKISKSLEDYKHGVFSSLLIFKSLTFFLETDYYLPNTSLIKEDVRQFFIRKEILRSIAGHTCPKIYHIRLDTLAFLLILCDELQEWNRPRFDDLKKISTIIEPKVVLKEYSMGTNQKVHIEFSYDCNLNEEDKLAIVKNKYRNIHMLLRSAKDDYDRKMIFNWDINFMEEKYNFCFNSNNDS